MEARAAPEDRRFVVGFSAGGRFALEWRVLVSEGWGGLRAEIDVDEQLKRDGRMVRITDDLRLLRQAGQAEWQDDYLLSSWDDATAGLR